MKSLIAGMIVSGAAVSVSLTAQEAAPAAKPEAKPEAVKANPLDAIPAVVAQYNGKDITKQQILDEIDKSLKERGLDANAYPPEMLAQGMFSIVKGKVQMDLFADNAAKAGFKINKEEAAKLLNQDFENLKKLNAEQYAGIEAQIKAQENMTVAQYIEKEAAKPEVQQQVAIYKWLTDNTEVTDKDVEKFYEENKAERFTTPADPEGSIRAAHIMIAVKADDDKASEESLKKATEIIAKLQKEPAAFDAIAQADSACPSGKMNKGQLGVLVKDRPGYYGKEFDQAAFGLEVGKITEKPVKSEHGYHIIRRDASVAKAEVLPLDDTMKEQLKGMLRNKNMQEFSNNVFDQAVKDGKVKIFISEPQQMPFGMMGQ
jgi:hypothetical protein